MMDDLSRLQTLAGQTLTEGKLPEPLQFADNIVIVPKRNPFGKKELWWEVNVKGPHGWVPVQSGPKDSSMFWSLGVRHELAKREP